MKLKLQRWLRLQLDAQGSECRICPRVALYMHASHEMLQTFHIGIATNPAVVIKGHS